MYKKIIYPTLIMMLFAGVMTGIIAMVDAVTKERIAELEVVKVQKTVLYVLGIEIPTTEGLSENEAISETYKTYIKEKPIDDGKALAYVAREGDSVIGVAFKMEGTALWGTVAGYFALSGDGKELLGVNFTSHSETPGLGGRIDEAWFKDQFRHLPADAAGKTAIYKPKTGGNVDTITGATLTSDDVLDMINEAIAKRLTILKEVSL